MSWAQRLKRVFNIDVATCIHCGGAVRIVACMEEPAAIQAILARFAKHDALDEGHYRPGTRAPPAAAAWGPAGRKPGNLHDAATTPQACARAAGGNGREKAGAMRAGATLPDTKPACGLSSRAESAACETSACPADCPERAVELPIRSVCCRRFVMRRWIVAGLCVLGLCFSVMAVAQPVQLQNGVAVNSSTNSASQNGDFREYVAVLPAGASNLAITMDNLTADLDLYVRFGQAPDLTTFDCRPFLGSTNAETCNFATPSTGSYFIRVYGFATGPQNFRIVASWTAPGGGGIGGNWVHLGPGPAHEGQVEGIANRPVTGAVNAVVPHPTNANILYVAAVNGGIWRTSNATSASPTWTQLTDGLRTNSIRSLAADPAVANLQTLVAGVGNNSSIGSIGGTQIGMLRSTDGGTTWTTLDGGGALAGRNIAAVAARGATLLAATDNGLHRSTNTGAAFTLLSGAAGSGLPTGTVTDMVGDPGNNAVFYLAAMGTGTTRGIYRSADTGATWTKVSDAAVDATLVSGGRARLAAGAANQVFAVMVSAGRVNAVFRYTAANTSWTALGVPTTSEQNAAVFGANPGGQGGIHLSIAADPTNDNIVYVGGDRQPCFSEAVNFSNCFPNSLGALDYSGRLFRGTIGANPVWTSLTHSGAGSNSSPHADSRGMAFDANGDLIEVDDGGVYKRVAPRTTTGAWFSLNGSLSVSEYHGIAYDALSNRVVGGTQDTGTTQQVDGTKVFTSVSTGDGGDTAVDNTSSGTTSSRYSSFQNLGNFRRQVYNNLAVLQSQNFPARTPLGGAPAIVPQFYTPIAVNSVNGLRLVILASNGVYESADQGATVSRIATERGNAFVGDPLVYGVPGNAEFLYFATTNAVFLRTTAGAAPTQRSTVGTTTIIDVAVDPATPTRLFAMNASTVHVSTNSGTNFSDVTGNLASLDPGSFRSMAFVPRTAGDLLVVGSDRGVFAAPGPAFNSWSRLGQGLPNTLLFELDYNAARDTLIAGMLGRGAWRLDGLNAAQTPLLFQNGFEAVTTVSVKE
jgi:hypothetical protein